MPSELLFRQVHPHFYSEGVLGSSAFRPNSNDRGFMSTDTSALVTAEEAYIHYTRELKKKSACVYGITVGEFDEENIKCTKEPIAATGIIKENLAHCLADYNSHNEKSWKNIAKRLKVLAEGRGRLF